MEAKTWPDQSNLKSRWSSASNARSRRSAANGLRAARVAAASLAGGASPVCSFVDGEISGLSVKQPEHLSYHCAAAQSSGGLGAAALPAVQKVLP
jgi:hypothetical protein